MIIETAFTPWQSLGGGLLIGLASVLLMATMGRIMGATGVLAGVLQPSSRDDWAWRAAIVLGMITGPLIVMALTGEFPAVQVPVSQTMLIIGGVIVGIGVTFCGNLCGLSLCTQAAIAPAGPRLPPANPSGSGFTTDRRVGRVWHRLGHRGLLPGRRAACTRHRGT